ncbi:MAG TPA: rod shape-determining protein MreD [Bacteroidota bacterium]|nr:rod shape-determining protein MreD [Bacteroidota bacterium]
MTRQIKFFLLSVLFVLIQSQIMRLLTLEGITPDILTIWVVYLALREGQLAGTLWGFSLGLMFDLVTGSFIGLSALSKTVAGFVAGYFFNENKTALTLGSYRFIVIVLITSLIHNTIYFFVFTQGSGIGLLAAIFQVGLATTFYTATITLLPMFAFSRRRSV